MATPGLRVLMATGVVPFHIPDHTSPKFPAPSFFWNWRVERSISHSSLQQKKKTRRESKARPGTNLFITNPSLIPRPIPFQWAWGWGYTCIIVLLYTCKRGRLSVACSLEDTAHSTAGQVRLHLPCSGQWVPSVCKCGCVREREWERERDY